MHSMSKMRAHRLLFAVVVVAVVAIVVGKLK